MEMASRGSPAATAPGARCGTRPWPGGDLAQRRFRLSPSLTVRGEAFHGGLRPHLPLPPQTGWPRGTRWPLRQLGPSGHCPKSQTAFQRIARQRFHLGSALGGLILLAIATNLPELAITVSAALPGDLGVAVGNILGGIALQTVVLVVLDVFGVKGKRPLTFKAAS